jgi:hypothetical protein
MRRCWDEQRLMHLAVSSGSGDASGLGGVLARAAFAHGFKLSNDKRFCREGAGCRRQALDPLPRHGHGLSEGSSQCLEGYRVKANQKLTYLAYFRDGGSSTGYVTSRQPMKLSVHLRSRGGDCAKAWVLSIQERRRSPSNISKRCVLIGVHRTAGVPGPRTKASGSPLGGPQGGIAGASCEQWAVL